MAKAEVRIEGFNEIVKKMKADELYAKPWREYMDGLKSFGVEKARSRAPKNTGRLAAATSAAMDATFIPLRVVISNDASNEKGYRYGFALNAGRRRRAGQGLGSGLRDEFTATGSRRRRTKEQMRAARAVEPEIIYHYAGKKKRTKSWFRGVQGILRRKAKQEMSDVARAIERQWGIVGG